MVRTDFLLGGGDANDIVEKITRYLEDQELAKRLGARGRESITKNFSADATARRFMDILEEIDLGK